MLTEEMSVPLDGTKSQQTMFACVDPQVMQLTFSVNGASYRKICGKLRRYQKYSPDSFYDGKSTSINAAHVDGISITIGKPHRHMWTYAVGLSDDANNLQSNCPCAAVPGPAFPSFIGEHYYCESGNTRVRMVTH